MAALALPASRSFLQVLGLSYARPLLAATASLPTFLAPGPSGWKLPTTIQSLLELLPAFDLAVPKKKTSHSRKSMRSANKGLKDKRSVYLITTLRNVYLIEAQTDLVHCPGCGSPKLAHHLCPVCYSSLSRGWKAVSKQIGEAFGRTTSP